MKEIQIFPIFNQAAPGVWDDFFHVHSTTLHRVYNVEIDPEDHDIDLRLYGDAWRRYRFNFAFGAYYGSDMIGFVQGDVHHNLATVQDLYVLPKFHGRRVGQRLLSAAESAIAIGTRNVSVTALNKAIPFYKKRGYILVPGNGSATANKMAKKINGGGYCQVVPVFCQNAYVTRACAGIAAQYGHDFTAGSLDCRRDAVFMYMDVGFNPRGYLVGTPSQNGGEYQLREMHIDKHCDREWVARQLTRIFDDYAAMQRVLALRQKNSGR